MECHKITLKFNQFWMDKLTHRPLGEAVALAPSVLPGSKDGRSASTAESPHQETRH